MKYLWGVLFLITCSGFADVIDFESEEEELIVSDIDRPNLYDKNRMRIRSRAERFRQMRECRKCDKQPKKTNSEAND